MTLTANAVAGASTVRRPYTKPEDTLRHMAVKIREAGRDPGQLATFRQFAEGIVSAAGYSRDKRLSHEKCAQIFLDYIRKNVRYRHDPPMVEYVQGASITLCVPGAVACIPVEDCDGLIVAFGSLCIAYGVEMQVIAQDFGPDKDLHVCAAIKSDAGEWLAADPTHPTLPVGRRLPAIKELWMDPLEPGELNLDGAPNAEFVAVGAIPGDALVHARQFGDVPASTWTLVSPAADGTLPVVAGTRYKMIVATPTNEPASSDATTLGAIAYLLFPALSVPASALIAYGLGASGSAWTAGDTTALFSGSGKWLVESVTGSVGAWQVQAIAKESMSLQSTKDVTYIQVLQQTPAAAGTGPSSIVPAAGFTTAQKVVFGGIVLSVVAGGIYVAVKHHQRYEIPRKAALNRHALARGER